VARSFFESVQNSVSRADLPASKLACLQQAGLAGRAAEPAEIFIAGYQVDTFRLYLTRHTLMNSLFFLATKTQKHKTARNIFCVFWCFCLQGQLAGRPCHHCVRQAGRQAGWSFSGYSCYLPQIDEAEWHSFF
jgi:hypothetical protein